MSGSFVQEIRSYLRSCTKVGDSLAAYGASVVRYGFDVFMGQVPEFVTNLVYDDMPMSHWLVETKSGYRVGSARLGLARQDNELARYN